MSNQRSRDEGVANQPESASANKGGVKPIALVAFKSPLLKFFVRPSPYKEVVLCEDSEQSCSSGAQTLSSDEEITSAVVLLTWADFLRWRPEDAIAFLLSRIGSHHALRQVSRLTVYLVPFASFVGPGYHAVQFVLGKEGSPIDTLSALADCNRLLESIRNAGYSCRIFFSPMIVAEDADSATGYPSFLQKLIRVSRCIRDEVATKVPAYFSGYAFHLEMNPGMQFNAAHGREIADSMVASSTEILSAGEAPIVFLESPVTLPSISDELAYAMGVRLESGDASVHNSLDKLLNELIWSDQVCTFPSFHYELSNLAVRTLSNSGLYECVKQMATHECEPWESSFAPTRDRDISKVPGLFQKELQLVVAAGQSGDRSYFEGGSGEAILMLTPISIEPGYFTPLVKELLPDHRVLVWQTVRQSFAEQITAIRTVLATEGITRYHIFTWCSSSLIASVLIEQDAASILSLCMVAPAFGIGNQPLSEATNKLLWLVEQVRKHPDRAERIKLWSAQGFKQLAGESVAEYASGTGVASSPLQHHPVAFWNGPTRDAERTLSIIDGWVDLAKQKNETASTLNFQPRYSKFDGPTVALLGTHDHLTLYSAISEKCRAQGWTIATCLGGNHYFILEHAPEVAALLRRVFREKRLSRATPETVRAERFRIEMSCSSTASDGNFKMNPSTVRGDGAENHGVHLPDPVKWSSIS